MGRRHGHSGVLPYIREGNSGQLAKSATLAPDYAVNLAEHGYVTVAPAQRGWNETAQEHACQRMTPIELREYNAVAFDGKWLRVCTAE